MNKFRYMGLADIVHLNTRKEGAEDDKELAVDIKFNAQIDSSICDFFDESLEGFLFLSDTGAVRNSMLGPLSYSYQLKNYRLKAIDKDFTSVNIKKISLSPRDGRKIDLTFQVSLHPSCPDVAGFANYLKESIEIILEPSNRELQL